MTRVSVWFVLMSLAVASQCVSTAHASELPNFFRIGRNVNGEACTAQANLNDPGLYDRSFDRSFALNCGNAAASRAVGAVRIVDNSASARNAVEKTMDCGAAQVVTLKGIGKVDARLCNDKTLGIRTVGLHFVKGRLAFYGNSALSLAGPLENALAIASGASAISSDSGTVIQPSFDSRALPALGDSDAANEELSAFIPRNALQQGIRFNVQGLHAEASRVLNDAISRLNATDTADVRTALELEAGLADSNIGFFESADAHFRRAEEMLSSAPDTVLLRKATAYRALDELNQRNFRRVVDQLDALGTGPSRSSMPLMDPVTIASLNQGAGVQGRAASAIAATGTDAFTQVVINAQVNWARSAALLLLNDMAGADAALAQARREFAVVANGPVEKTQTRWLEARIERQAGRLAARKQDWTGAIRAFDASLGALRAAQSMGGFGGGPEQVETQLERANILTRQGAERSAILGEYRAAVDTIVTSGLAGKIQPSTMEPYLALLVGNEGGTGDAALIEEYFRTVQAVGTPAIARQISQLQSIVSADPVLAAQIRERADLAQELTALRFQIGQAAAGADVPALEKQRNAIQARFQALDDSLASNERYKTTDDRPATIGDIQAILGDGEIYFKLTTGKTRAFGLVIGKRDALAYQLPVPVDQLMKTSADLRLSIDKRFEGTNALPNFRVGAASALFAQIAGPAADRIASAKRIISDPSGPLQRLPLGVLVVDRQSAIDFAQRRKAGSADYSQVDFLAGRAEISTALSPRSFINVRGLAPSAAPRAFMGFGEHAAPTESQLLNFGMRRTPFGCIFDSSSLKFSYDRLQPISRAEIISAANAVGDTQAVALVGSDFTDGDVKARTDLDQFAILHFATHGLQEGLWAQCRKAPPALVTSLGTGNSDGLLSFDEIAALRLDANLVFLSACDTEAGVNDEDLARLSGKEERGASLEGLVRAFLAAKVRGVVATYWEASAKEGTNRLIDTFYATGRTQSLGAALRDGQQLLMRDPAYSHPFYWAPYFLVGDAGKTMLTTQLAGAR